MQASYVGKSKQLPNGTLKIDSKEKRLKLTTGRGLILECPIGYVDGG